MNRRARAGRAAACLIRALGFTAALLAGCASLPEPPADAPRLAGRLAVRVDSDPVRAVTAAFELRGDARLGVLRLSSPLGDTLAEAQWSPVATVLRSGSARAQFADLDDLAAQTLGERLPMAALFDWLRGRPWPGAASAALPAPASGFEQLGWQVRLERFADGLVEARREAPPVVTLRARLEEAAP